MDSKPPKASKNNKVIDLLTIIAKKSKDCGLVKAKKIDEINNLKSFLSCTRTQALFFALIVYLSVIDDQPRLNDLAKHLDHDPLDLLSNYNDLRALEKKGLVRKGRTYRNDSISEVQFYAPSEVIDALSMENPRMLLSSKIDDSASLFSRISKLLDYVEDNVMNQNELCDEIMELVKGNSFHYTIKNLNSYKVDDWNKLLILTIGAEFVKGVTEIDLDDHLKNILDEPADRFRLKRSLIRGTNPLIKKGILKLENSFFKTDRTVYLTDKAIRDLFDCEMDIEPKKDVSEKEIIMPAQIKPRKLFYNEKEYNQLNRIDRFLSKSSYSRIIKELGKNNLPEGVPILFYGSPGTGKTEAVYQLARKLKKVIFRVDISSTKSMWYGESEKEIKKLFDRYRALEKNRENCPILLFNEADAILGTRKKVGRSPVDQTENAIQNIILQEMEDFKGIMIATTNLTVNFDSAFERRFLYKVRFDKPEKDIRSKIWKEHIPDLKPKEALRLADLFDFSGGEISNIARKVISNSIVSGNKVKIDEIISYAKEEKIVEERRFIGF